MKEFSVKEKSVTVVGAARSGVAAALLLAGRGARVTLTDMQAQLRDGSVEAPLRRAGVSLELGEHRPSTFSSADLIVLSPGVPPEQMDVARARRAGVPVIGEVELASRWLIGRIVAITGTKGKSTTATLTGRMFNAGGYKALVGGNIGTPLSTQVADSTEDTFHIIEVSSFQLETTESFHPWIAVLLNLSPDHLDRHASIDEYAAAKAKIFSNQTADDWAVINADDASAQSLARQGKARQLPFALERNIHRGIVIRGDEIAEVGPGGATPLVPLSSIRLLGRHLTADVMAAAAVARLAGVSREAMVQAVEAFTGLEHALEVVGTVLGVRFVNDSKATNVDAAKRAIETFDTGVIAILGGRFKGGDLSLLIEPLRSRQASVVAIGEARELIARTLQGAVPVHLASGMESAVRQAFTLAPPGGTVVMSPACASFDMFRDYAERGRAFKLEVARLAAESKGAREQ